MKATGPTVGGRKMTTQQRRSWQGLTGERLCQICRKYHFWEESVLIGKRRLSGRPSWFCVACFERRRPDIENLVGVEAVAQFEREQDESHEPPKPQLI